MAMPLIQQSDLPPVLYHYTDCGGLAGILEHHTLWATHAAYLNDTQELSHGLDATLKELGKLTLSLSIPPELNDDELWPPNANAAARWVGAKALIVFTAALTTDRMNFLRQNAGPFVICLTTLRDRLSQWRGYAGDGGYAIGFDAQALRESVREKATGTQLKFDHPSFGPLETGHRDIAKMQYGTESEFIRNGLIAFFRNVLKYIATQDRDDPNFDKVRFDQIGNEMVRQRLAGILGIAIQTKHPGFEEEDEYRIITFDEPDRFHAKSIGLVPRLDVEFEPSCVKEILVGPGANLEVRQSSIEYFKNTHPEYSHVQVWVSETPFRGT